MAIKWRDKLSVGNDQIDFDHKRFIEIINEIEGSLIIKNKVELEKAFDNLYLYSLGHFAREERLARSIGFPDVPRLHDSHTGLGNKLLQLKQEIDEDWSPAWIEQLTAVLRDWLLNHIINEDMLMKPFFTKKAAEMSLTDTICRQTATRSDQESSSSQSLGDSRQKNEVTTDCPAKEPTLVEDGQESSPIQTAEDQHNSQNVITSRAEILSILDVLRKQGSLIACRFNHGKGFLLTQILNIFPDGCKLLLDHGHDISMNRNVLLTSKIYCESRFDKVKIEFVLHGVAQFKHEGHDVFQGSIPASLMRSQQREFYRLPIPKASPISARIPVTLEDGSLATMQAEVADISGGGISIAIPPGNWPLKKEDELFGASIDLPRTGSVRTDLRVLSIKDERKPSGRIQQRAICAFNNLPKPMTDLIQHYSHRVQREYIARLKRN